MTRWLAIIGIGEGGIAALAPKARGLLDGAEVLVGGTRHLAMVPDDGRHRIAWPSPLLDALPALRALRGRPVCILASGDPQWFGVGATLARHFHAEEMDIVPAPSAFSLVCARLGWSLADATPLTLHGRPVDLLRAHLHPGRRLLVLSQDGATPAAIARILASSGFGNSRLSVFEHLDGPRERRLDGAARNWGDDIVADLNTVAVDLVAGDDARPLSPAPGLPDSVFHHDGQLTKCEVRAATLAALAPLPGQCLWDVGAGSGSIAIEWMRAHPANTAIAVERSENRARAIADNALNLGVPTLTVLHRAAPDALRTLSPPDAVFIGGGISDPAVAEAGWSALPPGGRLVANVVTIQGEAAVFALCERYGGALTRISVSRADPVGPFLGWRPLMPVTQWSVTKGQAANE